MDLNDMELPASLLTGFYRTHLVENTETKPATKTRAKKDNSHPATISYLGKNQKEICLLVSYSKDVYLPDEQLHFLTTILQACRLNLGDVAIVNHFRAPVVFEELYSQMHCKHLLVFGVDASILGLPDIPLFTAHDMKGCQIVLAPPAEQLNTNTPESKSLKSKLWNCLKQMFNV